VTKDEALQMCLEYIETDAHERKYVRHAIKQALAQPAQEPVAWLLYNGGRKESFWMDKGDAYDLEMRPEHRWEPLYTAPPQRPWVGLTDEEAMQICVCWMPLKPNLKRKTVNV
jgi:hypothetical protein